MVIILFKKTSFSSKAQTNSQTAFFCFFIVLTYKLKTNCILFFTEIMDSFLPKKGAASSSKGKKYFFIFIVVFVIAGDLFKAHCSYICPFCPF